MLAIALALAAAVAIGEAAVAGVAGVLFTERLGPKTVAFAADQARLQADDPIRAALQAVRRYLPADTDVAGATAAAWLDALLRPPSAAGAPAYAVPPAALVMASDESLRDAARGAQEQDTLALFTALGEHPRTLAFRRLARFAALDSLFATEAAVGPRARRDSQDLAPVRTPLEDGAIANAAGAVAAVARRALDSAIARLGENAAFAAALLLVPDPRVNQIGARILTHHAIEPLATLAALRGDAAAAAQLADAAQRMAGALPAAGGAAGLAVDPRDLIQFTGAVLNPRVPAGYRIAWLGDGWAGLCTNPWELLAGPSAARKRAILAAADLAADIPRAHEIAAADGERWSFRERFGGVVGFVLDRGPWGLVVRIRMCGRVT